MENNDEAVAIVDLQGNRHAKGTKCVAEQNMPDGSTRIYFKTFDDIKALVEALRQEPSIQAKPHLLTTEYWLNETCSRMAKDRCFLGDCPPGPQEPPPIPGPNDPMPGPPIPPAPIPPPICEQETLGDFVYCHCASVPGLKTQR